MALAFCIAAGYNACKKELNLVPAQAMRPKPPATGRKILIENISIIWKKINFSWKIILRNLFRYKKRSAMASVGIIFSIALLLVALGSMDSMDSFMNKQFNEIQKFDIKISFSKILNADELQYIQNIEHIESIEPILESGMEVSSGWRKKDIGLVALPGNSKLYGILDEEDKNVKIPDDGILLPKKLMDTLGVKVGDTVFLRSFYPGKNDDRDKKKVMIMGTVSQITGQSAICSTDYLNYLIKEGVVTNAAHIKLADAKYESEVIGKLKDIMEIKTIQSKAEIIANTNKMMESTSSVYVFMILGAGILAFAVIYNITNINIFERRREIATLAVLGFTDGELKSLIFNENFFIGIFGSIVGIPLGRFLIYAMFAAQENENIQFSPIINLSSYIYAVLLIGVFILMANFLLSKKIKSINMVESLKSSE
ncbi:ABC transporter permease [Anaerocolumna sedimenticola]|uniref:ABC transporter permease n=1 Tax=Anaerocolumna sedimenticola TaxID=2696063 RepID=UPI001FE269D8|nr:FtsX-like permease family protein [Anaerocolumna sedimenticola]